MLPEIGGAGQQRLKAARILIVGAGGLGAPLALYLAAAGIGTIGIVDDDVVSLSNLQRQIIHRTDNRRRQGGERARDARGAQPACRRWRRTRCGSRRKMRASSFAGNDVVADGSDNFATRYLVADICAELKSRWSPRRSGASTVR